MYKLGNLQSEEFQAVHAPKLAKGVKQELEAVYTGEYGKYLVARSDSPLTPDSGYAVRFDVGTDEVTGEYYKYATCECPDLAHRGNWCKHMALCLDHHLANAKLTKIRRETVEAMTRKAPELVEAFLNVFTELQAFSQRPVVNPVLVERCRAAEKQAQEEEEAEKTRLAQTRPQKETNPALERIRKRQVAATKSAKVKAPALVVPTLFDDNEYVLPPEPTAGEEVQQETEYY